MKFYEWQIRTGDFEYINGKGEFENPEEAVQAFRDLKESFAAKLGDGIPKKDWCRFLDVYLSTGSPPEDGMSLWQDMNQEQKIVVNEMKKALARITRKNNET